MSIEIAFFISLASILVFLIYKVVVTRQELVQEMKERERNRYDPIEHVFSFGALVFDVGSTGAKKISSLLVRAYRNHIHDRRKTNDEKRYEKERRRGAASFYLKKMAQHKKDIRKESENSLDNK